MNPVRPRPGRASTRRTVLAGVLALAVAGGAAGAPPVSAASGLPAAVGRASPPDGAALSAALRGLPAPHATAALVRVGGRDGVWHGSAGVRDLESGRPAVPGGRFRAGSVTKVFVAAAVLQLAGEGRIDLGAPVRSYLPELIPAGYGAVTVRQLLNHTHGIPAAGEGPGTPEEAYARRFEARDPREAVRRGVAQRPEFAPGTRQKYHNMGYTVAGLLIERVTGDSYERQITRRIIRPLGLRDTYLPGDDVRIRGPHNRGYQTLRTGPGAAAELRDVTLWHPSDGWAAGDLISTTGDLERFLVALFRGRVVRGPLLEEMFTLPRVPDHTTCAPAVFGAGLSAVRLGGREVWGKSGGRYGYGTLVAADRELSRTLVLSVNATDAKSARRNPVSDGVAFAAFGAPEPPVPGGCPPPAALR
ncbi:serine hydrolase domain-containing protein [Streptomyces tsukubensis]|uniref:Peptidase n=1 Tax=Streptomyces tsukubensis (strain DSM 42081 / NBRC 108919 / NRRL 18488 / 9993) TaxID=1114943 RepID=A0A7G3UE01_STRT9|nr:serine hydrolase domain-containing protein [Streptomyces tsukubensis]AZK96796.1 peptidase [Streptomyces tsukubensis]QKM67212.1 peptidase [Streptomyces tsukubensis NRRL18488]TAI41916.1 class A beta-lactamase-related serine hydrolase [Streptomyces tsukubensis]